MQPYLGPPWTHSHQIWAVDDFHHAPATHGIQNAEMQKKKIVMSSLLYSTAAKAMQYAFVLAKSKCDLCW